MSIRLSLSPRDMSMLRILSWTPLTTRLMLRASCSFDGEPFHDERRLRERLQTLAEAGIVRSWPLAQAAGGLQNYYKLTPIGIGMLQGTDHPIPPRAFFAEVAPSLCAHTFRLAALIVEVVRACHARRVAIDRFIRENELTFTAGDCKVQPDCFFRLVTCGRAYNLAIEIDNSTASVDAAAVNSIRRKLTTYTAYQELVLAQWAASGKAWERPRFRVVFLTQSTQRAYHILALAAQMSPNRRRRLAYGAAFDDFVTAQGSLHAPVFLDHFGNWQALVDLHPSSRFARSPVRLVSPLDCQLLVG